jgi:hypothetical protein
VTYQDELEQTVTATAAQVTAAVAAYEAGALTSDALAAIVAAFITAGNGAASALADLSLAAALTMRLRTPVAPLGITRPADDPDRLAKAVGTLLAEANVSAARWERLARAEGQEAAARAYSEGITRSRHVTGWRRGISGSACQLCRWWSRNGQTWPADHPMPTHKGCTCHPEPVTR